MILDEALVPKELWPTFRMLRAAYPDGIPDRDYFCVLALLGPYMSERGLGEVLSCCSHHDRFVVGNDWAKVASTGSPPQRELDRVREVLEGFGYAEWRESDE